MLKTSILTEDLGSLETGKTISSIIKFSVPSTTPAGFYNAQFIIEACDSSTCKNYIHYALITVQPPTTLEISRVSPTTAKHGQTINLNMTLTNDGDTALNNLVMVWSDPTNKILPLGTSNRKFIQAMSARSSIIIPLSIVISPTADSGTYPISVSLSYNDNTGNRQSVNTTIGFMVIGDFNFIVTLDSQDSAVQNKSATANIKIANGGTDDAQFLVATLESEIKPTPDKIYIGSLQSNDYDTEKFSFISEKPGEIPVKIKLEYRDIYGNSYADESMIKLVVFTKEQYLQQNGSGFPTGTVIVIAFALIVIAYFLHRRRNKKQG
jgi:uncharacterized repeat protein (TIGR01451 family)